jgi:mono/diheme cytochrome c family protein
MNRKHAPFMLLVFTALVTGVWAGLLRSGWQLPTLHNDFALAHGVLMIGGFMGTLINLERAVALHGFVKSPHGRTFPYLAPMLSAAGALTLIVDLSFAAWLITLSSVGMVLIFGFIVYKQFAVYTVTMATGAVCWFVGNLLWLGGEPLYMSAPWWMVFLILTIAGERLELARLMRHKRRSIYLFAGTVGVLLSGLVLSRVSYDLGMRLMGAGNIAIALWLLRYDVIHRTLRQTGLPRFIAVCLALGYGWLGGSGAMSLGYGGVKAGLMYDAILHSLFLGFAFSMIFGHAPIILPAVLRLDIAYSPLFYIHLTLLHLSMLLRVGGDLMAWQDGRRWGAMLNALVLLVFIVNMIRTLHTADAKPLIPRSKPAYAVYTLVFPLVGLGFLLIAAGIIGGIQREAKSSDTLLSNNAAQGERLYQTNCSSCHGMDLQGITHLGKNLLTNEWVASLSDAELHAFIVEGRPAWHPDNTTGIEMPARGGNPALSDGDIDSIIAYIREKARQ